MKPTADKGTSTTAFDMPAQKDLGSFDLVQDMFDGYPTLLPHGPTPSPAARPTRATRSFLPGS